MLNKEQKEYNRLMRRCIKLAKKGEGRVSPNPLVGAVIFDDDYRIISEGFHEYYGGNHAERNAVLKAKEEIRGKSIIVNLEPCSHYGKTPPCADLLIESGIKRVITGMVDPNPKVCTKGISRLKDAGIEVRVGILEEECKELNKIFIKNQKEKKPYIAIKTGMTLDGKIASRLGKSKWITNETSRKEVQKLRNKYDAIITGSGTVLADNPSLTCRMRGGRNPVRIIYDTNLRSSSQSKVFNEDGTRVIVICSNNVSKRRRSLYGSHIEFIECPEVLGHADIKYALDAVYEKGIRSILTECGGELNRAIIQSGCADELIQFIAPKILGDKEAKSFIEGYNRKEISECNNLKIVSTKILNGDIMICGKFGMGLNNDK